jgi:hypothetical protein
VSRSVTVVDAQPATTKSAKNQATLQCSSFIVVSMEEQGTILANGRRLNRISSTLFDLRQSPLFL